MHKQLHCLSLLGLAGASNAYIYYIINIMETLHKSMVVSQLIKYFINDAC